MNKKIFTPGILLFLSSMILMGQQIETNQPEKYSREKYEWTRFIARDTTIGVFSEITPSDSVFVTPDTTDFWVVATASADYDKDGDVDIAVLGFYVVYNVSATDRLILMRNDSLDGTGAWKFTYIDVPLDSLTAGASDMAWGDADGDGDPDLVVGTDGITVIYRNDGGSLILTDTQLPGYWEDNSQAYFNLHSISWADYDNDGDPDLLIPSSFNFDTWTFQTSLMRNDGPNGTGGWIFTETDSVFALTEHAQSEWADYDSDGDLDLLLVNISPTMEDGFIRRYLNDGNGIFTGDDILGSLSMEHGEVQWGDYDGDGDLDILVAGNVREEDGSFTPMALRIYQNENEVYTPVEIIPDPASEGWFDLTAATWADYDSDGDMDILLAGHYNSGTEIEGRARIYTNSGNIFSNSGNELPAPHASGDRAGTFSWLDLDGDGDLDYFIAGEYFVPNGNGLVEAQMHLYRNDTPGQNFAPLAPTGLAVNELPGNIIKLSWLPSSDDHTPAEALTYDLRLFRNDLPLELPAHPPEPGNVSGVTQWLFEGLEPGNYSYTLSSVDASYTGSQVAAGGFTTGMTSAGDGIGSKPDGYTLGQNYPNPFITQTTISFTIPSEGVVFLEVYDIRGFEVMNLFAGKKQAGTYQVKIDAGNLPDGVYYYRLTGGDFSQTKKMVILQK
jgi:hypothetical protein